MSRVGRFALRRASSAAVVVLTMITITFAVFWAVPNEPAQFVYPFAHHLSSYEIKDANHLLGTDRPGVVQYADYLWKLVQGDLGHAWTGAHLTPEHTLESPAVGPMLGNAAGITASVVLGGVLLVALLSIPLGAIAGRLQETVVDHTISLLTLVGICTHPMVVGLILRTTFADRLGWLPPSGYCNLRHAARASALVFAGPGASEPCHGPVAWAEHLLLPWLSFSLLFLALYTRVLRASVIRELDEDYVRTARAKGASETRVIRRHVLPNALLPILTLTGVEVGTALGITVYIESVFGLPGLGRLSVTVLVGSVGLDLPVVLGTVVSITLVVVVASFVVDTLYAVLDPRITSDASTARKHEQTVGAL